MSEISQPCYYIIHYLCAMALPDLQVVLWYDDRATSGDVCTRVLAVAMRVISLPQVLVGCTLSERKQATNKDHVKLTLHRGRD